MKGQRTCKHDDFCLCVVARPFAMLAMGIAVAKLSRDSFAEHGITREVMSKDMTEKLRQACVVGQVKTIVAQPEPYEQMVIIGGYGVCRYPYGVNLSETASWYGKRTFAAVMPEKQRIADAAKLGVEVNTHE